MSDLLKTRNRKSDSRDGWYLITPAMAMEILENRDPNRPLRDFRAQLIGNDMAAKKWRANGEPLIFDEKGHLLDGQHRLRACILADAPFETYCIFGIPRTCFPSFDQGSSRSGGDLAATMGFQNYMVAAAAARLVIEYDGGTIGKTGNAARIPNERIKEFLSRNRDQLQAAAKTTTLLQKGIRRLVPLSHVCFLFYKNCESHEKQACDFIEKLSSGANLRNGDPVLLFRNRMDALKGSRHQLLQSEKLALLIKTWNAFLCSRSLGVLKWNSASEPFPTFEEKAKTT